MAKKELWQSVKKGNDPDRIFDMIIATVYFAGQFGNNIPVDESRDAFKKIKKLLTSSK